MILAPPGKSARRGRAAAALSCAVLIASYAIVSWLAVRQKSATADEPLHALGAYLRWFDNDFRLNVEDPPLWSYLAMLPHHRGDLTLDKQTTAWPHMLEYMWSQPSYVTQMMYRTPGNDPVTFINRSRWIMILFPVALATLLARWAWQIAGPPASLIATALFCADPTFIGHGPLVKDDVPMAFVGLLCAWTLWRVGMRATIASCLAACVALGMAFTTKFSGVLFGLIATAILAARVLVGGSWLVLGRQCESKSARMRLALLLSAALGAGVFACIWAAYGFRFRPTTDPQESLNLPLIATAAKWTTLISSDPAMQPPAASVLASAPLPLTASIVLWLNDDHVLPQAYLAGFLDTYATTLMRPCFLLGKIGRTGWWYYFPLALAFKLPLATLTAMVIASVVAVARYWRKAEPRLNAWTRACLWLPVVIYGGMALLTHLNLGVRHVLPICPFMFLLVSVTLAPLWGRLRGRALLVLLLIGLIVESAMIYPNDIAFFNAAVGGPRGGFHLLGDSNLDWGQDLPLLKQWQQSHPQQPLYVAYFGMADPGYYLATYTALPGNSGSLLPARWPDQPGVLAIGASVLQGTYLSAEDRQHYQELLSKSKLIDVLGQTIYLYQMPAAARPTSNRGAATSLQTTAVPPN